MDKVWSENELFADLNGLTVRSVVRSDGWIVEAEGQSSAVCPSCGVVSHSRHSRYWRQLNDLPLQGTCVQLKLRLGRWRCRTPGCVRQIFAERVAGVSGQNYRGGSRAFPRPLTPTR